MYLHWFERNVAISVILCVLPSFCRSQETYESSQTQQFSNNNSNFLANATQVVVAVVSCMILFLAVCYCLRELLCKRSPNSIEYCPPTEIKSLRLPFQEHYFDNQLWDLSSEKSSRKLRADNRKCEAGIVVLPTLLSHSICVCIQESPSESHTNSLLRVET